MEISEKIKTLFRMTFERNRPGMEPGIPPYDVKGIPGNVQRIVDETAINTGKKIWRGMIQSLGSGIGKGAFIAASILVLAKIVSGLGVEAGLVSLFTGGGPAVLAVGALLGAVMEIHHNQKQISADVARAEARTFEAMREQPQPERSRDIQDIGKMNFALKEMARKEASQRAMGK